MAIDTVVAAGLLAVSLVFTAAGHPHHTGIGTGIHLTINGRRQTHPLAMYLIAPFASLPLAVRRRWPVTVFVIVLVAGVAFAVAGSATSTVTAASYALYTVAVQAGRRWSLLALLAAEAGVAVSFALTARSTSNPVNGAFTGTVQLTIWLIGDSVRRRRAYNASMRERSIRQALTEQRLQIARELHDVIAHALSVVAVQAGVGSHLIATRPDEAARSLGAIEATARSALSDTRYVLGALRDGDHESASMAPVPGTGDLGALVNQVAGTGRPVTLQVEGRPRPLPPSQELTVYRVVQEALTNVVRHAGPRAAATVVVGYRDDGGVAVEVTDNGRGLADASRSGPAPGIGGQGYGLAGMRERVSLLGGELRAGPRAGGGYQVLARLPARDGDG